MRQTAFLEALLIACALPASAQHAVADDNGTDPTKLSQNVSTGYEYVTLPGGDTVGTLNLRYGAPISSDGRTALQLKLPLTDGNTKAAPGLEIGDVSVKLTRVLGLTRQYGVVASAELSFDTAAQSSGGSGTEVLKLIAVYARFLQGGAIFAPAVVHSEALGNTGPGRADISNTVVDFYYVPKLADKRSSLTLALRSSMTGLPIKHLARWLSPMAAQLRIMGPALPAYSSNPLSALAMRAARMLGLR